MGFGLQGSVVTVIVIVRSYRGSQLITHGLQPVSMQKTEKNARHRTRTRS